MPTWPKDRKYIGSKAKRVDGPAKVTGAAEYTSDVQPSGWLYGMILRSKWAAAKITNINLDKASKVPGIKAAILDKDIDPANGRIVRFYGEELAAVAGTTKQACLDALRLIEVEATPLPFVVREEDAKNDASPVVWPTHPNAANPKLNQKGDVDKACADCTAVVEGFYTTPVLIHNPLETHGNTISWTDEGVTAWISTQAISGARDAVKGSLNVPANQVRVLCEYMGGGFGSKLNHGREVPLAGRLSKAAGAPVKLMLTRFDANLAASGNRPSSFQIKLGASADGTLQAFEMENYGTPGMGSAGVTEGGSGNVPLPAPYIYNEIPNTRDRQYNVVVNAGSSRAFRAPPCPPASFGIESIMDEMAVKLNMDPVELRIKNDPSQIRQKEYKLAAERFGWKQKYKKPGSSPGPVKTGVGCAGASWGGGGWGNNGAQATINSDGTIEICCGTQDLGTGVKTVIAVVAPDMLGLTPEQIRVKVGDTNFPSSIGSGGSATTPSVAPTINDLCTNALAELQKLSGMDDARGANWAAACKKLGVTPLVVSGKGPGPTQSGTGGVQFAEVEVDTETGFVKVKKITCIQDCGMVVSKLTCESQVNGGIIMGMGYALYEERVMDARSGVVLNPNLETYKLPALADMPEIDVVLLDMPERGPIGIGEPVTIPTAAAIANAVANALGVRVNSLPITPGKVLAALGKDKATA